MEEDFFSDEEEEEEAEEEEEEGEEEVVQVTKEDSPGEPDEKEYDSCPLTRDHLAQGLSLLCRTGDGLAHAFSKLDLKDNELTDIDAVSTCVHLRFLDVSNNHLSDLSPLTSLTQLLWLKVNNNAVSNFKSQPLHQLPYLQWLSLAQNKLVDMEGLGGSSLETLNLTGNRIRSVRGLQYEQLTNLTTLELRGNRLETTDGLYLPNLKRLYLGQNLINRLEGLDGMRSLTTLHLRDNKLDSLDGISPNMTSLRYINVRGNLIHSQNALQSLLPLSHTLQTLVISYNPLTETGEHRLGVLTCLPYLVRLDKEAVDTEERAEAQELIRELAYEEAPELEDE